MMDIVIGFMKQEAGGLPYWGWFALAFGIACVLIVVILVTCLVKRGNKKSDSEPAAVVEEPKQEEVKEAAVVEEKPAEEKVEEKPAAKKTTTKTTAKKTTTAKSETKTSTSKTTATKTTAKTTATKTTAKKEEPVAEEKAGNDNKVYHISKRKEDGKWQVKAEGSTRALRLFFTQADAIKYAKKVAGNQEGRIVVHKESGGFRKVNY